jgi:hypothetical protein
VLTDCGDAVRVVVVEVVLEVTVTVTALEVLDE